MGQLWEPGTVVSLLGPHKLLVKPPDVVRVLEEDTGDLSEQRWVGNIS